jgi:hypothetical protein
LGDSIELYRRAPLIKPLDKIIFVLAVQQTKNIIQVAAVVQRLDSR